MCTSTHIPERKRNGTTSWNSGARATGQNVACKKAIEEAIRQNFDGMHLNADCAEGVITAYGFKRVNFVLANTLREFHWDGRFSQSNKEWSKETYIPPDKDHNSDFIVGSHPAVLDGFINQYRRAYQALGLFDHTHCVPDKNKQNFEGKVLVLSPDTLKESSWKPKDQLWLATGRLWLQARLFRPGGVCHLPCRWRANPLEPQPIYRRIA